MTRIIKATEIKDHKANPQYQMTLSIQNLDRKVPEGDRAPWCIVAGGEK